VAAVKIEKFSRGVENHALGIPHNQHARLPDGQQTCLHVCPVAE
jgi:hypothetical protein